MAFVWCILVTTCIGIGFKLFPAYRINTFNAIVINYSLCVVLGSLLADTPSFPFSQQTIDAPWFSFVVLLGILFISGFNLTARAIQQTGITLTTITQRMSILLTVTFTVLFFPEHFGWLEAAGLLLAVAAIVSIQLKPSADQTLVAKPAPLILLAVLVMSATIEIVLYYVEKSGVVGTDQLSFTTHGFGVAAIAGWLILITKAVRNGFNLTRRDIVAGILLGLPNFFSIYLLLYMLNSGWKGSIMYPMVNVSVLLLSTAAGVIFFREKLNRLNWAGIIFATMSILVISYAHNQTP